MEAGTSHFLGQNFAKAFDVKFTGKDGKQDYVWATSWGVSTRLMGALVMAHSDDQGLVLPPRCFNSGGHRTSYKNNDQLEQINKYVEPIVNSLKAKGITVKFDNRDTHKPGWKFAEYELKGVPVRIAVGPRDMENGSVEVARRDTLEKAVYQVVDLDVKVEHLLNQIQDNIYKKALTFREENTFRADTWNEFTNLLDSKGGFIYAHWDGTSETEQKIKELSKATIRCIPLNNKKEEGKCILTGNPSAQRVLFARAY